MNSEMIRKMIDDTGNLPSIIEGLVELHFKRHHSEDDLDSDVVKLMEFQSKTILKDNFNIIERTSESPIEKYFFHSFNISALLCGLDLPVTFLEPHQSIKSAEDYIDSFRRNHEEMESLYQRFLLKYPKCGVREFLIALNDDKNIDEHDLMNFKVYLTLYRDFMCNAVHFIPQAKLPNTTVNGKDMRVDGLLWIPSKPDFKFIIECDGYEYHRSKQSFTNDRQRDRILTRNGYQVLRYSGTEIWNNPVESGLDLADFLLSIDVESNECT